MNIVILTAYTPDNGGPWDTLAECCLSKLRSYAQRHGYYKHTLCVSYGDAARAFPWQKTEWVRDFLRNNPIADAAWVLDIDTLITNPEIGLESFMDDGHDLFIGEDINGLNSGSYILRNTAWAHEWLSVVLRLHGEATSENHAMQLMVAKEWMDRTKIVEGLNSIPYERYPFYGAKQVHSSQWAPGHLLMHLPGMTPTQRVEIFTEVSKG